MNDSNDIHDNERTPLSALHLSENDSLMAAAAAGGVDDGPATGRQPLEKSEKTISDDGDLCIIRTFALVGGVGLVVNSCRALFVDVSKLQLLDALYKFYSFALGCITIILEGNILRIPKHFVQDKLLQHASFLKFVWGRSCLYFVAGTIHTSKESKVDLGVGIFMCLVGIIYCIVGGTSVKRAVDKRRSLFSKRKLRDRFNEADKEGNGSLRLSQFRNLTQMLGVQISDAEAEMIYTRYQQSGVMGMKFNDFMNWWTERNRDSTGEFSV
eukprot:CAMPEP_0198302638 /NCGR_PEP_ID=MMETSP1449-20131203/55996_1 /TAXON_ID=420275 /ORGANISM="Attheya septentrionalis, Strain CCMP2084" /LENGTH=268 /DNA_ID=CAMNT_0044005057 /DNA_START=167 /DNA_END=973 /DNA_ORIENTATION=+